MLNRSAYVRVALAAVVGVLALTRPIGAQAPTLKGDLLQDWAAMKDTMMKIADAMPADRYGFRATPAERSYAEQILHVADGNRIGMGLLGTSVKAPTIDMKGTAKPEVLKALADSYDFGAAVIRALSDEQLLQPVRTLPFLGMSTRARTVVFELGHAWDIYGQMAVYLRLNGIVPPASQRP